MNQALRELSAYYETLHALGCSVCGEFNLEEYLCFNCKGSRECLNCCGCEELEEAGE